MSTLTDYPLLLCVLSFVAFWLCALLGAAVRRRQEAHGGHEPETFTIVLTASLTLLGLIVGFTFSMAVSRYDQRKNYEAAEANAIGTEYVRAGLLPANDAAMTRMLLRSYLDERIRLYQSRDEDRRVGIRQRIIQLQEQLWSAVQGAALAQPSALTALAAAGMNDVLNSQAYTQAAWWNRIPTAAWLLMLLIALVCNLMVGYAASEAAVRSLLLLILPLLLSIAFLLIADIDSPRGGVIHVSPQNLVSLSQQIGQARRLPPRGNAAPAAFQPTIGFVTLFATLADTSQRVGATAARSAKIRELAAFLTELQPEEIGIAVHYLAGEMMQGRIGIGPAAVSRAATRPAADVSTLSIAEVDRRLTALAAINGAGSTARRAEALRELFALATAAEQRFLLQLLVGEVRQGALEGVMLEAIAAAARMSAPQVRRAAMYSRDLGAVAQAALLGGAAALGKFQLELFVPIAPMLAQTAPDVATALRELGGEAAFEWKMDGARIQVHKRAAEVRIYTRGLNDVTAALPEIVELAHTLPAQALIIDGEAIAVDAAGRPHPFQITMRRVGRRLDVEALRSGLPLRAFFFDCLRIEEQSIADRPTRERTEALAGAVPAHALMPRLVTSAESAAREFYDAALAAGHEGLMAKSLDAPYEAGNRGAGWLKIKRAYTLDLVILAAEWGHGRRTGKLSNLHLGALDPSSGQYVMLGKTFKGLTDAMLEWQTREFLARETHRDRWTVYLKPELVVEVAFSDLQASSRYPGGLALRLARVKRYRSDKSVAEADTMDAVRRIYAAQSGTPGA